MKKFFLYIPVVFLFAFTVQSSLSDIIRAFKSGSATVISASLDQTVEITIAAKNSTYNKVQAQQQIKDFFATNTVRDFKVLHQSESGGSAYCIGSLVTSNGTFRVTLYAKEKGGKTLLQEIRFEK